MNSRYLTAASLLVLLAACESAEITQPPVQYKATQKLGEKGVSSFTARTYLSKGGDRKELSGVPCKFVAPGFHATFVTPALVSPPDRGPRTPAGSITCTYEDASKLEIMKPVNKTVQQIEQSAAAAGAGAGLIGGIVTGISASTQKSRRDARLDIYGYNDVSVTFKH